MNKLDKDELSAWLRLCLTSGVGNLHGRKLLTAFGLPQGIFSQNFSALRQVVSAAMTKALQTQPENFDKQLELTWSWLQAEPLANIITLGDAHYPEALLQTEDPPLMLYALGNLALINPQANKKMKDSIAIVGSRNPTPQGVLSAYAFAKAFSETGITVVSGLALGIDGAAHEGALDACNGGQAVLANYGSTIAVVGTGLDRVYPAKHHALAKRMVEQQGLLISEFPLGTPPLPPNFPKRNRIISALSLGTLVVEATVKSGSLITARMAIEQGKEVFAIPGSIHAPQSRGCHTLIKQGAKLVETAQDVLEELRPLLTPPALPKSKLLRQDSIKNETRDDLADNHDEADSLVKSLGYDPVSLDALVARTGWDAASLQVRLMELELDGEVARLPGGLYQRIVSG
ncbi:MAG TPA: DNA-processing protein DprA [Burkholderiaceae bacterium]|nr:DNA-processing protein DprA [Burkholderiaceae bacterium]